MQATKSEWWVWIGSALVLFLVAAIGWLLWQRDGRTSLARVRGSVVATVKGGSSADEGPVENVAPVPSETASRAVTTAPPFASEREYWDALERLSAVDPPQALQLALAGERWYSDRGRPAEARRAMIVSLLVDAGRMSEARDWTRRFIQQYPDSSFRSLVQGKTGIHPRPGPDGRIP